MKTRDLVLTALAALSSMTVTLALLWPSDAIAKGPGDELPPTIRKATLKLNGCELSLRPEKTVYGVNEKPVAIIEVANPSASPVTLSIALRMETAQPEGKVGRIMRIPEQLWSEFHLLTVPAGETKCFSFTATPLKKAGLVGVAAFVLLSGDKGVRSSSFTVGMPDTAAAGGPPLVASDGSLHSGDMKRRTP
jgi:hypothetical protein